MTEVKREIIKTKDGSHSLYQEDIDEHYHSIHGAMTESKHIFIEAGLSHKSNENKTLKIFEVGFGTGLNAALSAIFAVENKLMVEYHTIELYPLKEDLTQLLNYGTESSNFQDVFNGIHEVAWNKEVKFNEHFELKKIEGDLKVTELDNDYDLVYFDAFAPEKQAEMWTQEVFSKIYNAMKQEGVLVTYCVKGEVRRRLQSIGFKCEKIPGPVGGKREMLRARKMM